MTHLQHFQLIHEISLSKCYDSSTGDIRHLQVRYQIIDCLKINQISLKSFLKKGA